MAVRPLSAPHARFATFPSRAVAGLALAVLLAGGAGPAAAGGFAAGTSTNFTTTSNPRAVVLGDVNNDGITDMVAPSSSGAGVSVFRGLGGGAFAAAQTFPANGSGIPALADMNIDGNLDICLPLTALALIQVYNGNGDGTFSSGTVINMPANAECLVTADFDGNGKADLATAGNTTPATGLVRVWLNNTALPGGFVNLAATDYAVGAQPRGIAVGLNLYATGRKDLVTANQAAGSVSLLKNDGTGHFGNRLDVPTKVSCYAVTVGSLWAGEDRPQIVAANRDSASVSLLIYNTNTSQWVRGNFATAADPRFVSLGDTDGNGNLDVVVSAYNSNVVSILSPTFDGTSNWLSPRVDIPVGTNPWSAMVVNFDGDVKPDLLCAVRGNTRISWVHGVPKVGWALGDTIPEWAAQDQFGTTLNFNSMHGKWVLLDMCSSWCNPCKFMAQSTQKTWGIWYRHPSVPFEYITALNDGDTVGTASTRTDAVDWCKKYGIWRPVLHSSDVPGGGVHAASLDAQTSATPTLRLIDPAGRVVWFHMGAADDTTIARVLANAAGVAVPLQQTAHFISGTETVTYGAQVVSCDSDPDLETGYVFPYLVTGFGENFTSDFIANRNTLAMTEDWSVNLTYWNWGGYTHLPTQNAWQVTLSNLQLDPATRTLPPGSTATVVVQDTFGVDHVLPVTVPVTWSAGTLTFGAIPAAALAAMPPIRSLTLQLTMQIEGWVADVGDPKGAAGIAMALPSPNPARSASRISWSQPRAGAARLEVYDIGGRRVRTLVHGEMAAGAHAESWNLADDSGARVGAGLYFARLSVVGERAKTQRITVVR